MSTETYFTTPGATWRQGDLLFRRIEDLPLENLTERENGHILEGEATGHIHRLKDTVVAKVLETFAGLRMFIRAEKPAEIIHEDHDTITLPPGNYEVIRQREYTPEAIRQIAD